MEIRLPRLHPGQIYVLNNRKRFNWLMAGRRWRKTCLCMDVAVRTSLEGQRVIWGAPVHAQTRIGWEELKYATGGVFDFNESKGEVKSPTGGIIYFRSLDNPDSARGLSADGIILDEVADIKEGAWNTVLWPMLSDTGGWLFAIGTPRGRNWAWREWSKVADDSVSYQIPTLGCNIVDGKLIRKPHPLENPNFSFKELTRFFVANAEQDFRQEFMAEFAEQTNPIFRNVRECATAQPYDHRQGSWRYIISCDLAKHRDFSVFTVIDITNKQAVFIDRFNQLDYTTQGDRLCALYERFRPEAVVIEANSAGEAVCDDLERRGLPIERFYTTNASKKAAIGLLALAFERHKIKIIPNEVLIDELLSFQSERLPSGALRYAAPAGLNDDCVMSLAIGWNYLSEDRRVELVTLSVPWSTR